TPAAAADGGIVVTDAGKLRVKVTPINAKGFIESATDPSQHQEFTGPNELTVPHAGDYKIHVELAGFTPIDEVVTINKGETTAWMRMLAPAPAKLHVVTVPEGAQTTLAGKLLDGDTPK